MNQDFEKRLLQQQNNICSPTKSLPASPFTNRYLQHSLSLSPKSLSPVTPDRCSDRFIPSRAGARWHIDFNVVCDGKPKEKNSSCEDHNQTSQHQLPINSQQVDGRTDTDENDKDASSYVYKCLLKNELLGAQIDTVSTDAINQNKEAIGNSFEKNNLFKYSLKMKRMDSKDSSSSPYSLSHIGIKSQKLLRSFRKPIRKIQKTPYKVLDAPDLLDDFYLNLVDWSSSNILSVALGPCVYMWSAHTSQVSCLCDLSSESDNVTSVQWNKNGNILAVGTYKGNVQLWDATTVQKVGVMEGHDSRVSALAWNGEQLSSGSRDRSILQRDVRCHSSMPERILSGHRQEVCGLKWSPDYLQLASGGNDNKLMVWNAKASSNVQTVPAQVYTDHVAAVKALAWSPHQRGLLASGGGTADRYIRFWNTLTQHQVQCVDTESQVCNLAWSQHANEFVSTHGYSQNQIVLWNYPTLTQEAKLTGHTSRVLYLATSPDGEAIVTGAGDETLRFWNVFTKYPATQKPSSVLNLFNHIR